MRRVAFSLSVLVVVAFLVVRGSALLPGAHAAPAIGNASVSGSYTFEFQGVNPISVNNLQSVTAAVGVVNFDGAGNVTGSFTSIHAQACCITGTTTTTTIQTGTFLGTYSVNPDGTANVAFTVMALLNPGNVAVSDNVQLVAGFSGDFKRFTFVQTFQSDATNNGAPLPDSVVSGRGEKVSR